MRKFALPSPVIRYLLPSLACFCSLFTLASGQTNSYVATTFAGQTRPTGDGGLASVAYLNAPEAVCTDSAGNVYIADSLNYRIRKVDTSGKITTIAGTGVYGYSGDGGPATAAQISNTWALAVDSTGNLYISDNDNNVVRMVSPSGTISRFAGNFAYGNSGNGGPATSASLNGPRGVAVDSKGNVYIADQYNNVVRRVSSGIISVYAGNGVNSLTTTMSSAIVLPLSTPAALTLDPSGNLYVNSDYYSTIVKITASGNMSLYAGFGYDGTSDGDNGPALQAHFLNPSGLAADLAGNLYIADIDAEVVRKVNPSGTVSTVAGVNGKLGFGGDGGPAAGALFYYPTDLAFDKQGNLLVADQYNERIRKVDLTALTISTTVGASVPLGDGGPATSAQLLQPAGTTFDSSGNFYIADVLNHRIRKVDTSGNITTVAGTGVPGYFGDGGPATAAQLFTPGEVAFDNYGDLLIADTGNNVIRKVSPTGTITTIAGTGKPNFSGDGQPASQATLNQPECVRSDSAGNLYIADTINNRIRKINVSGIISTFAGSNATTYGDGGIATSAQLNQPSCVAFDSSGNVYIADTFNHSIRKVSTSSIISTIAGNQTAGFYGDGGPATSANLNQPLDVAVDSSGNLFIADSNNSVIRKVTSAGVISTVAGNNTFASSGDGGQALNAAIGYPVAMTLDSAGNIYVADNNNNHIRKLTVSTAPQPDFTVSASLSSLTIQAGSSSSFTLSGTLQNGLTGILAVYTIGYKYISVAESNVSYTPSAFSAPTTLTVAANAPLGTSTQTFLVQIGAVSHTVKLSITVTAAAAGPVISSAGIANAASFAAGAVAPGEIVTIYGSSFGPATLTTLQLDSNGKVLSTLAGTTATFNGVAAPIVYDASGQMSVIVPYEVAGMTSATLQVTYNGVASNSVSVPVTDASPALFTYNASGSGPVAALNQDNSVNTAANPASIGSVMTFYGTGEGQTSPGGVDGQVATSVYPKPVLPVSASIGGVAATVLYYGAAPGDVAGAFQLNLMVPSGITTGSTVPVTFTVGSKASQPGVTIAVH